jgi:putative membrane protein
VVGLLSIVPTMRFPKWRRAQRTQPDFVPPAEEIKKMRRFIHLEAGVFILIPVLAAMMVRL